MVVTDLVPFKYLVYSAMLSDVVPLEEDDTRYGVCGKTLDELRDLFYPFESTKEDMFQIAIEELGEEGLVMFGEDELTIYLGEFRGKKFFTFEVKNSLSDKALDKVKEAISFFKKSKSAIAKSRGRFIQSQLDVLFQKGIDKLGANDFTEIHGFLYELYTGGETYIIRNKVEYFQTNNMLKAYDKFTTFAILVEGVLNYDSYRDKGLPTLTNVAYIKDDIFRRLTNPATVSKEYMREVDDSGKF